MAEVTPPVAQSDGDPWFSDGTPELPSRRSADPSPAPASQQLEAFAPGAIPRLGVAPSQTTPQPLAQLPVVDLIGLRFSLLHLRLIGYGLLVVWFSEILNLLTSPGVGAIATRLHYISQFLDLSPILLVAIGLIAFQGGLRRGTWERVLLPLLLTLLPLLSAFHFFLAPISIANAITLVQKQEQIGQGQIEQIDRQINRATSILRESDSIEVLLQNLERIPGLQVRVPPEASVAEARLQVRRSLERERDRLRTRINSNVSDSRGAFLRRSISNALLALLLGLSLWALHRGALREMELSIPFLDWVLVQGEVNQQPEALQDLLRFQRACVALGWFTLLESGFRLLLQVRPSRSRREITAAKQKTPAHSPPPPNPFDRPLPRRSALGSPRQASFLSFLVPSVLPWPLREPVSEGHREADDGKPRAAGAMAASEAEGARGDPASLEPSTVRAAGERPGQSLPEVIRRLQESQQRRENRRRQRDLERYRRHRRRIERDGLASHPFIGGSPHQDLEGQDSPEQTGAAWSSEPRNHHPRVPAVPDEAWDADAASRSGENPEVVGEASADLSPPPMTPAQWRRLQRDHGRAREALQRMADSEEMRLLVGAPEILERELLEAHEATTPPRRRPLVMGGGRGGRRGLAGFWFWLRTRR